MNERRKFKAGVEFDVEASPTFCSIYVVGGGMLNFSGDVPALLERMSVPLDSSPYWFCSLHGRNFPVGGVCVACRDEGVDRIAGVRVPASEAEAESDEPTADEALFEARGAVLFAASMVAMAFELIEKLAVASDNVEVASEAAQRLEQASRASRNVAVIMATDNEPPSEESRDELLATIRAGLREAEGES